MKSKKSIEKFILFFTITLGLFLYSSIFLLNLNRYFEKKSLEHKRILNYEKEKLNNIFSSLNTYCDYINLRLNSSVSINKIDRYLQIQKILKELNILTVKQNSQINIYDQTNENFFNGSFTNKLEFIKDSELKNIIQTADTDQLFVTKYNIFLVKQISALDDFLILLKLPRDLLLTNNKYYSVSIENENNGDKIEKNLLVFKYLNKNFKIKFLPKLDYNIRYLFLYFILPLIGTIIFGIFLYKTILFFFSKQLQILFEKIQGEKVPDDAIYLDDIYNELINRNKFILEKSQEIEKTFNERVIGDFILGVIPFKDISNKVNLPEKVYCGILEINNTEYNLDDYLFSIKKLIHQFENKNITLLLLEKEHIFIISDIPFLVEEFSKALTFFTEDESMDIFGILSNKEISIENLPEKKIELENLLIYKEKMKDYVLVEEDRIYNLSFEYSYFYPINTELKLISKIKNFDLKGSIEIIENIFNINFNEQNLSVESIKRLKRIVVNSFEKIIIHLEIKNGFQDKDYFLKREKLTNDVFQKKSLELLKFINEKYKSDKITEDSNESKMWSFIENNYNREVSLLEFAEYMNFTSQYLSNIYKKTFGENFNTSLNRYRIQKSIEIFIDYKGNIKIKDLGEMVGYTNTITFINNFKKFKNTTPTNFFEKYLRTREKYLNP